MIACAKCGCERPNSEYRRSDMKGKHKNCLQCRNAARLNLKKKAKAKDIWHVPTGTNPFDWQNYRSGINWNDNNRYIPDTTGTRSFYI